MSFSLSSYLLSPPSFTAPYQAYPRVHHSSPLMHALTPSSRREEVEVEGTGTPAKFGA